MISIDIVHNWRKAKNQSNKYPVHLRIILNRKAHYLPIDNFPKIESKYWSAKKQRLKDNHHVHYELNIALSKKIMSLEKYVAQCLKDDKEITISGIKNFYLHQGWGKSFNAFVEGYIKKTSRTMGTYTRYMTLSKHLHTFDSDLKFSDINTSFVEDFNIYLIDKKISGNTRKKMFSALKSWVIAAQKKGLHKPNPFLFDDLKIQTTKPKRTVLNKDEIARWINHPTIHQSDLEIHRLHFSMMLLTGLYYGDFKLLSQQDCIQTSKGLILTNERQKTNTTFYIPLWLFPEQMNIFDQIRGQGEQLFDDTLSDQKFNSKLKTIAETVGIQKNITNKVARHSFTDLCISKSIAPQFVSKMLGHTKTDTTQVYYNMNAQHVIGAINPMTI